MLIFLRILLFALFLCPGLAQAQPYTFRNYSLSEGLPQSQVLSIIADSRGYLWIGTAGGGLCRYDGEEFEVFTTEDGLPSNFIRSIYQYEDYGLMIGTSRGLAKYDGNHFSSPGSFKNGITVLTSYKDSILLIGTNEGLFMLNSFQDSILHLLSDSIGAVLTLHDGLDNAWIGTTKGLWKIESLSSSPAFVAKMLGQGIYDIEHTDKNSLWLASWNVGIIKYDYSKQKIDTVIRNNILQLPQCIFEEDNQLWVGTQDNGIILLNLATKQFTQLAESAGLPHYNVKAITQDASGTIWIATSGGGIAKCLKQNFRQYTRSDGLHSNRVYAVHAAGNKIWIASGNGSVQSLDSTGFRSFQIDSLVGNVKCKTILEDNSGKIWIGTEGRGIVVIDDHSININHQDGLHDDWILKLAKDINGNIWAASYTDGLASIMYDSAAGYLITKHDLPFNKLGSLYIDKENRVWVGSNDGRIICMYNKKIIWESTPATGLPQFPIRSFAMDDKGRLWIGTESKGVYYGFANQDNSVFQQLPDEFRLKSQNIYLLLADHDGNIWIGHEKGVERVSFDDKGAIRALNFYGKSEGFEGIETCHDAATVGKNGNIWFGTMNGLMRYIPGEKSIQHVAPKIHFENVSLFYKPIEETPYAKFSSPDGGLLNGLILSHRDNHLSFTFRGIDLNYPDQLIYRWKLQGADKDWSPPSEQSGVNYAALSPGDYTLMVQASAGNDLWSDPIEASFRIEAPFWQKKSFIALSALAALALITTIFYVWSRHIKKKESARRHQLELENKLLHLEQKALQLQMNPHFIFNALTSIKSLVAKEELSAAQEEINAFAQLMRSVLNNSRKQNITLADEISMLDKYLHIEQLCHQDKFAYKITVEEDIDPSEIEIPPMLLQPFVENAVVHGISNIVKGGMISIDFRKENDLLVCQIRDNGPGREKAARLRDEKKPGHQPVALEVTKERLEAMRNGSAHIPLTIEDILDEKLEIAGTLVTVRIPMKSYW